MKKKKETLAEKNVKVAIDILKEAGAEFNKETGEWELPSSSKEGIKVPKKYEGDYCGANFVKKDRKRRGY